ncbi:MAG: hypothetical protein JKY44_07340 [Flavobacteriaceae bacterium]|nr:hypothetical protein [Flavobacteriaceae bacterium]
MSKGKIIFIITIFLFTSCEPKDKTFNLSKNYEENLVFVAKFFNDNIPNYYYKVSIEEGFNLNNKKNLIIGLNIFDLNTGKRNSDSFKNGHVYHISPSNYENSLSYIFCVFDNELKIFKTINCSNKGDTLSDVIQYAEKKLKNQLGKSEIIERINNYRNYGSYFVIDTMSSVICD